jgi:uncharacterized protein YrrD
MLHRTAKVIGFHLQASDGEIGHIDDLLFDERDWTVRYLVVDTNNWIGGKSVLVSTAVVSAIDPIEQRVTISLTQDQVKAGPAMESADVPAAETQHTIWIM